MLWVHKVVDREAFIVLGHRQIKYDGLTSKSLNSNIIFMVPERSILMETISILVP